MLRRLWFARCQLDLDEDPLRAADRMTLDRSMSQGPPASASRTEAEKSRPPIHFHPLPSVVFFFLFFCTTLQCPKAVFELRGPHRAFK